jgi:hypothetical protein
VAAGLGASAARVAAPPLAQAATDISAITAISTGSARRGGATVSRPPAGTCP